MKKLNSFIDKLNQQRTWFLCLFFSFVLFTTNDLSATYISAYTANTNGGLAFTGNTLGLNKATGQNQPGTVGSIGAFITTDTSSRVGFYPAGTTLNWRLNSSTAILDIPANSTILHAHLIWSGSFGFDPAITLTTADSSITFITPDAVPHTIAPNPLYSQFRNLTGSTTTGHYVRAADVTSLVTPLGAGKYTVGGVPATVIASDDNSNCAGWTLAVAYFNTQMLTSNLTIYTACEASGAAAAVVGGFHAPSLGQIEGVLFVSCVEGDPTVLGDQFKIGVSTANTAISGPNNPSGNFFCSQINTVLPQIIDPTNGKLINNGSATLDNRGSFGSTNSTSTGTAVSGARQGYDITAIDVGNLIGNDQTSFFAQGTTTGDSYVINSLGVQIQVKAPVIQANLAVDKTTVTLNSVVTYTSTFTNIGELLATSLEFTDILPTGLTLVPNSLKVNGVNIPGANIVTGVPLNNLAVGASVEVTFQAVVSQFNPPNTFKNASMVTYSFTALNSSSMPINLNSQTNTVSISGPVIPHPVATPDTAVIGANSVLSGLSVLSNDTGTNISVTSYDLASAKGGSVVVQPNGFYTYNPPTGFSGIDTFNYTITDSINQTASTTVTIIVKPVATGDTGSVAANTILNQSNSVLLNDIGTGLTISNADTSSGQGGTVFVQPNGSYIYIPPLNFSGIDTFNYTVTDSAGNSARGVVTIRVLPIAQNNVGQTLANTPLSGSTQLVGKGFALISFQNPTAEQGTVAMNNDGTYIYTPPPGFSGIDTFEYTYQDGGGNLLNGTVTITVIPRAVNDAGSTMANVFLNQTTSVLNNDIGQNLSITTYNALTAQGGIVVMQSDGTYVYTPPLNFSGPDAFNYSLTDGISPNPSPPPASNAISAKVNLTVLPVANNDSVSTLANTALIGLSVLNNDIGSSLTIQTFQVTTSQGVSITLDAQGNYTYTPPLNFSGFDSFEYSAVDFYGNPIAATVTITVLPIANNDSYSTQANTLITGNLLTNDVGSGLTAVSQQLTTNQGGSVIISQDGSFTYVPPLNFSGIDTFNYTVIDSAGNSATAVVTIRVLPIAQNNVGQTPANTPLSGSTQLIGTGFTLISSQNPTTKQGTVAMNNEGTYTYTPALGFSGIDTFEYAYQDGGGNLLNGTVTITVIPLAVNDAGSTMANVVLNQTTSVFSNDIGQNLSITAYNALTTQGGIVVMQSDGTYVYTPPLNFSGPDDFNYSLTDGVSPNPPPPPASNAISAKVNLTVLPVANNDSVSTLANTTLIGPSVLNNDIGSSLKIKIFQVTTSQGVSITLDAQGNYTYTPPFNFSGFDSFEYSAVDFYGNPIAATVTITVQPIANNESYIIQANTPLSGNLLTNDVGSGLNAVSQQLTTNQGGSVIISQDGSFTYAPLLNFSGIDTFNYTVIDSAGNSATAVVTIRVLPIAENNVGQTLANTPLSGSTQLVGTGFTLISFQNPTTEQGTVAMNNDGTYTYTPALGFSGIDTFEYTYQDGGGNLLNGTVTITVIPLAVNDVGSTMANVVLNQTTSVLSNDIGQNFSITTYNALTAQGGTVVMQSDGTYVYTPPLNFSGPDAFYYSLTDGVSPNPPPPSASNAISAKVNLTVLPVANNSNVSTSANTTLIGPSVLNNDIGSSLKIQTFQVTTSQGVSITLDAQGNYTYTPPFNFSGFDSFEYSAVDFYENPITATVTITVQPIANDESYIIQANTPLTGNLLTNDVGSGLTAVSQQLSTTQGGSVIISQDGSFAYTPPHNFSGIDTFNYTVTDSAGNSATAAVTIRVLPIAENNVGQTLANTPLSGSTLLVGTGFTLISSQNPTAEQGTVAMNNDGTYTYTPALGFSGIDTFEYTYQDGGGNLLSGTVTITVIPLAVNDAGSTMANVVLNQTTSVLSNDIGQNFSITTYNALTAQGGTVVMQSDGTYVYTPPLNFSGPDAFYYSLTDGVSPNPPPPPASNAINAKVNLTVLPVANNNSVSTPANTTLIGPSVLNNDIGSSLKIQTFQVTTSHGVSVTLDAQGNYTYTPPLNFSGFDSFEYYAVDFYGNLITATVTITVQPIANNESFSIQTNTPLTGNLLTNDVGSGLNAVSQQLTTNQGGSVIISQDGSFAYVPPLNYSGLDSFTYTIIDSSGNTAMAIVSVQIDPVANNEIFSTNASAPLTGNVIAGNSGTGLSAVLQQDTTSKGGAVIILADGSFTYSPPPNFSGTDTFSYTIVDSFGNVSTGTVSIIVLPVSVDNTGSTSENVFFNGPSVLANDIGSNLSVLTFTPTTAAGGAVVMNLQTGTYTYIPPRNFTGVDSFNYTIIDGEGRTSTAAVFITVGAPKPPSNFEGIVKRITCPNMTTYRLRATWNASTSSDIVIYRIYYKNKVIKEIPANQKLVFRTSFCSKKAANRYSMSAVNSGGAESARVTIQING